MTSSLAEGGARAGLCYVSQFLRLDSNISLSWYQFKSVKCHVLWLHLHICNDLIIAVAK